jgi:hypothetical protein
MALTNERADLVCALFGSLKCPRKCGRVIELIIETTVESMAHARRVLRRVLAASHGIVKQVRRHHWKLARRRIKAEPPYLALY